MNEKTRDLLSVDYDAGGSSKGEIMDLAISAVEEGGDPEGVVALATLSALLDIRDSLTMISGKDGDIDRLVDALNNAAELGVKSAEDKVDAVDHLANEVMALGDKLANRE